MVDKRVERITTPEPDEAEAKSATRPSLTASPCPPDQLQAQHSPSPVTVPFTIFTHRIAVRQALVLLSPVLYKAAAHPVSHIFSHNRARHTFPILSQTLLSPSFQAKRVFASPSSPSPRPTSRTSSTPWPRLDQIPPPPPARPSPRTRSPSSLWPSAPQVLARRSTR